MRNPRQQVLVEQHEGGIFHSHNSDVDEGSGFSVDDHNRFQSIANGKQSVGTSGSNQQHSLFMRPGHPCLQSNMF